jgi:hypothetical protein
MCWIGNAFAFAAAAGLPGVQLVYHCRVGSAEAFVLRVRRADADERKCPSDH